VGAVPEFFVKFLTRPGNTVLDPFSGSNVVGKIAEGLERRWISIEIKEEYVVGSAFRFNGVGPIVYRQYASRAERS
jgi:site-specific DNA-methyltransferase (cytosine-N4-specific)